MIRANPFLDRRLMVLTIWR